MPVISILMIRIFDNFVNHGVIACDSRIVGTKQSPSPALRERGIKGGEGGGKPAWSRRQKYKLLGLDLA